MGEHQYRPFYRSGSDLVNFFNQFGSSDTYGQGFPSRKNYTREKLAEYNDHSDMEKIIFAVVDSRAYLDSEIKSDEAVAHLNKYLEFDSYKIVQNGLKYVINKIGNGRTTSVKNLIFAANGPKPEIVLEDATTNDIRIVKNAEFCLVYNRSIRSEGLLWQDLVSWWSELYGLESKHLPEQANNLYKRLLESLGTNNAEKLLFKTYYHRLPKIYQEKLPALIPQVYLHYDPKTLIELKGEKRLPRQRIDFLLLLPQGTKVVIELDGKQHYAKGNSANPELYAEMVAEDRRLKLAGYEVFRFGGYEFMNQSKAEESVMKFFEQLLDVYL